MNFELKNCDRSALPREKCDALVLLVSSHFKAGKDVLSNLLAKTLKNADLSAKAGEVLSIYRPLGWHCTHLVLAHAGDGKAAGARQAIDAAMALIKSAKSRHLMLHFTENPSAQVLRSAICSVADGSYVYSTTKSQPEPARTLEKVVCSGLNETLLPAVFAQASAAVKGIELAKEWGNRPANHATPSDLAEAARALGKLAHIKTRIFDHKEVSKLGMGAFLAVAQGSAEPLRFIVLQYSGAAKTSAPVVLVGKGLTFDSGGISLKPGADMDEMKFDMCGAASVLGVFRALAELQPKINVVGLIPSCENLPSSRSVKPGDVVRSLSGLTIEVLNTDAEGRLILCDALSYAERFKPRAVIDIATLTGACVIALGGVRSGCFSTDQALSDALLQAGESAQDLCWPMPLDDAYAEGLKSRFADLANVAGRAAGSVTAAKFLQRFTANYPWAHLDIAGTAWKSGSAKGATGRPVGLLLDYLMTLERAK